MSNLLKFENLWNREPMGCPTSIFQVTIVFVNWAEPQDMYIFVASSSGVSVSVYIERSPRCWKSTVRPHLWQTPWWCPLKQDLRLDQGRSCHRGRFPVVMVWWKERCSPWDWGCEEIELGYSTEPPVRVIRDLTPTEPRPTNAQKNSWKLGTYA